MSWDLSAEMTYQSHRSQQTQVSPSPGLFRSLELGSGRVGYLFDRGIAELASLTPRLLP